MDAGHSELTLNSAVAVATIVAGVPAVFFSIQGIRAAYGRTIGRRRALTERLRRLGTGARLAYFEEVLGLQAVMRRPIQPDLSELIEVARTSWARRRIRRYLHRLRDDPVDQVLRETQPAPAHELFYLDRECIVQVVVDEHDTVMAYSITTRDERFHPTLDVPPIYRFRWRTRAWLRISTGFRYREAAMVRVTLGRTKFTEAMPNSGYPVGEVSAWQTPRIGSFSEAHFLGNAGYYQTVVLTAGSVGRGRSFGDLNAVMEEIGWGDSPSRWNESITPYDEMPALRRFRASTAISTITVIGPALTADEFPSNFGPHGDEIRLIP